MTTLNTCIDCGDPLVSGYKRDGGNWPPGRQFRYVYQCSNCVALRMHRARREEFLSRYGNKCACCGESEQAFLTVGHIKEGVAERHPNGKRLSGDAVLRLLERQGWPNTVRIECYNCNNAKARNNGVCPHEERS